MRKIFTIALILASMCILSACFTPMPLVREGLKPLAVESLTIRVAPVEEPQQESNSGTSLFGVLSQIQKVVVAIEEIKDPDARAALMAQYLEVERILVDGIAEAAGVPLLPREVSAAEETRDSQGNISSITYSYAGTPAASDRIDLAVDVSYWQKDSLGIGLGALAYRTWKVKPRIQAEVKGSKPDGKAFWRERWAWNSPDTYKFGGTYVFGLTPDEIKDAKIFLVPISLGLIESIQ